MEALYEDEEDQIDIHKDSRLSSKFTRKLQKGLILAFTTASRESKSYRLNVCLNALMTFVAMVQAVALVLPRGDPIPEYDSLHRLFTFIHYVRLDALAYDLGLIREFFYVLLVVVYASLGVLVGNMSLVVYWKKKPKALVVRTMVELLNVLEQILLLPALTLMLSIIKYTFFLPSSAMYEYGDASPYFSSSPLAAASIATSVLLVALLYTSSYFCYENEHGKRRLLVHSMRDSLVHRAHIGVKVAMVLCYCLVSVQSKVWYKLAILLLCLLMFLLYASRLCYFNSVLNTTNATAKAVVCWSVLSYFVGFFSDSASVIVIMVLFVSPIQAILIHWHIVDKEKRIARMRLKDIDTGFVLELKLRSYLRDMEQADREEMEGIHMKVDQLFHYATCQFAKNPLFPVWEALYYIHYRKDPPTAMLKLSKTHIAEATLESLFFTKKIETRLLALEKSPERMYLSYLKRLDRAKRADEACCMQLLTVCTELLGRRLDTKKFDTCVNKLATAIDRTKASYNRILSVYSESEDALQLLGSFLCDIARNDEGKIALSRAEVLRNNEIRRTNTSSSILSSNLFSEQHGLLVISCCIQSPGVVRFANTKAYEVLKSTKVDLLHKSIISYIPDDLHAVFADTLTKMALFGSWRDSIGQLFSVLVDSEGYLVSMTTDVALTTLDNKPHALLRITERERMDVVLIDRRFIIRAYSNLSLSNLPSSDLSFRGSFLDVLFPSLVERLQDGMQDFFYCPCEGCNYIVSTRNIEFRSVQRTLIQLKLILRSSRHSTVSSIMAGKNKNREEEKKGVRFHAGSQMTLGLGAKWEGNTTENESLGETDAKFKRKFEITSSVATSSSSPSLASHRPTLLASLSIRRVKLFLVLSFIFLATGLVSSVIFVVNILNSLKSISVIKDFSQRNFEVIDLAFSVRSLMLSDNEETGYSREQLVAEIQESTDSLNKITEYMKSLVGKGSREADVYLTEQKVPMWLKMESTYAFRKMTLLDAMYSYTTAASRISVSSSPFSPQADAFFIFRNGVSDFLSTVNSTLSLQVRGEEVVRSVSLSIIDYLMFACGALVVLPILTLVVPQFVWFERTSRSAWRDIYSIPREAVLNARNTAGDRLQHFFGNDLLWENAIAQKHSACSASPTKLWPAFAGKLAVYFLLNVVFFVVIEVAYFTPAKELALTIPNYLFWMGMRPLLITESLFWSRERLLQRGEIPAFLNIVPEGQLWYRPIERVTNATSSISFLTKLLHFGDAAFGIRSIKKSNQYIAYVLVNACTDISVPNCQDLDLNLGLTYASKDWNQYIKFASREFPDSSNLFPLLVRMEAQADRLMLATNYAIDYYEADAIAQIDMIVVQVVTITVTFIVGLFALYVLLYARALTALLRRTKEAINVNKILGGTKT